MIMAVRPGSGIPDLNVTGGRQAPGPCQPSQAWAECLVRANNLKTVTRPRSARPAIMISPDSVVVVTLDSAVGVTSPGTYSAGAAGVRA